MLMKLYGVATFCGAVRMPAVLACTLLLCGCAQAVHTQVSAFKAEDAIFNGSGTLVVLPANENAGQTLEFAHYRQRVEAQFAQQGYTIVPEPEQADYLAEISYSVSETEVNDDYYHHGGYVGLSHGGYYGSRVGVVLVDDGRRKAYLRRVNMVLTKLGPEQSQRIYEITGVSQGSCGVMSVVFDEMLEALFQYFPEADGSVQRLSVSGDARC